MKKKAILFLSIIWSYYAVAQQECDTLVLKSGEANLVRIIQIEPLKVQFRKCGEDELFEISTSQLKEIKSFGIRTWFDTSSNGSIAIYSYENIVLDTNAIWNVKTKDGNEYFGPLVKQTNEAFLLRSKVLGDVLIPKIAILEKMKIHAENIVKGEYWYDSPHTSRYLWAPSAYGLNTGEGYYQNTMLFFNHIGVGINKYFSIGAGILPLFLVGGQNSPIWITPRVNVPILKNKLNATAGVYYFISGKDDAAIGYSIFTVGKRERNVSFGMGYDLDRNNKNRKPIFTLCGMYRVSRKFILLTENYRLPDSDFSNVLSFGARYGGRQLAIDFGGVLPIQKEYERLFLIPWLGINVPFGMRHRSKM